MDEPTSEKGETGVPSRATLLLLGLVFAVVMAGGCGHPEPSAKKAPAPETIEELKKAAAEILARNHIPGAGIALVTKDDVIWTGGFGKADLATGREVDADTLFRIGSITKGFVALSILQLQEKGKLSLDAKLADVAPEIPIVNRWERTDPVRIANLLEHTAGFDDFPLAEFFDFANGPRIPLAVTLLRFPEPLTVRWRPGTFVAYSNPGYGLAGYIVEKAAGAPFENYVYAAILRPLGMTHSDLRLTPEVKDALAQGYEFDPPRPVPYLPILLRSAGEMKSSANDMARFVRMMLNRGELDGVRIVSADSIARMEVSRTSLAARSGLKYGYGLGNLAQVDHAFITHGHDGGLDGFLSDYRYIPDLGVGYFFSVNDSQAPNGVRELDDLLLGYVTRGKNPPPKAPQMPLDARIENATGFYEFASPRSQWAQFLTEMVLSGWTYIDHGRLYRRGLIAITARGFGLFGRRSVPHRQRSGGKRRLLLGPGRFEVRMRCDELLSAGQPRVADRALCSDRGRAPGHGEFDTVFHRLDSSQADWPHARCQEPVSPRRAAACSALSYCDVLAYVGPASDCAWAYRRRDGCRSRHVDSVSNLVVAFPGGRDPLVQI